MLLFSSPVFLLNSTSSSPCCGQSPTSSSHRNYPPEKTAAENWNHYDDQNVDRPDGQPVTRSSLEREVWVRGSKKNLFFGKEPLVYNEVVQFDHMNLFVFKKLQAYKMQCFDCVKNKHERVFRLRQKDYIEVFRLRCKTQKFVVVLSSIFFTSIKKPWLFFNSLFRFLTLN